MLSPDLAIFLKLYIEHCQFGTQNNSSFVAGKGIREDLADRIRNFDLIASAFSEQIFRVSPCIFLKFLPECVNYRRKICIVCKKKFAISFSCEN